MSKKEDLKQRLLDDTDDDVIESSAAGTYAGVDGAPIDMTDEMAERLIQQHGYNELTEIKVHPFWKFLSYFRGPIPFLMEAATLISFVVYVYQKSEGSADADPATWIVLLVLLLINGIMGFKEESSAGNAIEALKKSLAPKCRVRRNGHFIEMEARLLVPGDTVILKGGDIVPADSKLQEGEPMEVDQSALTGESLPVTVYPGDVVYSGSIIKRGELHATVVATGSQTFFGKAAALVGSVQAVGHLQQVLLKIAYFLMFTGITLVIVLFIILLVVQKLYWPKVLVSCLVLIVASIPIAMQVVTTATMAVGARNLAHEKAIVARLAAIEELAGMTILCSDKTGTLTKNKLTLDTPTTFVGTEDELVFASALAAKWEGQDAIDFCLTNGVKEQAFLKQHKQVHFIPFDPVIKRTEATIEAPDGSKFRVSKGAPQVIAGMAHNKTAIAAQVDEVIEEFGTRGFRALGVARTDASDVWHFLGLVPLFDPPRDDTKQTIENSLSMGVEVKMITGDHMTIAKETCRRLGMGTNIYTIDALKDLPHDQQGEMAETADGFAQVFPEHKFEIVEVLQKRGHLTGMTGDGVNDAPALKRADVGIAVEGATDAARAAADIVLVEPGLSVIIIAMTKAREIFARMKAYVIYRIAATTTLLSFMFIGQIALKNKPTPDVGTWTGFPYAPDSTAFMSMEHPNAPYVPLNGAAKDLAESTRGLFPQHADSDFPHFTLPAIVLVILTILNDGTIMSIAYDRATASKDPQKWRLGVVLIITVVLGLLGFAEVIIAFAALSFSSKTPTEHAFSASIGRIENNTHKLPLSPGQVEAIMYLLLSIGGQLIVFAARTESFFFTRRPSNGLILAFCFAQTVSTLLTLFWPLRGNLEPLAMNTFTNCLGVGPSINLKVPNGVDLPVIASVMVWAVKGGNRAFSSDYEMVNTTYSWSTKTCVVCGSDSFDKMAMATEKHPITCALHAVPNAWAVGFALFWAIFFFIIMDVTKVILLQLIKKYGPDADDEAHMATRKLQKRLSVAVDSERRHTMTRRSQAGRTGGHAAHGSVAASIAKQTAGELASGSAQALERMVKDMGAQMDSLEAEQEALRTLIEQVVGAPVPKA